MILIQHEILLLINDFKKENSVTKIWDNWAHGLLDEPVNYLRNENYSPLAARKAVESAELYFYRNKLSKTSEIAIYLAKAWQSASFPEYAVDENYSNSSYDSLCSLWKISALKNLSFAKKLLWTRKN